MPSVIVPVRNFVMIKRLEDDPAVTGGVRMIGTCVQYIYNQRRLESLNHNDKDVPESKYFAYRFNDRTYDDETTLGFRRTEVINDGGSPSVDIWRSTFQVSIPMKVEIAEEAFPFKVFTAKADIELSTGANGLSTIRPNLVVAREDKRLNVNIQEVTGAEDVDHVVVSLDRMAKYTFLSPYPEVTFRYEGKKGYCPRCSVTFYLKTDGFGKFVASLFPFLLVSWLNTLYLINDMNREKAKKKLQELNQTGSDEYNIYAGQVADTVNVEQLLVFEGALTLAVVFLLGTIYNADLTRGRKRRAHIFYIIFIFIALILSSVPASMFDGRAGGFGPRIAGVCIFWLSFAFPFSNVARMWWFQSKKKPKKGDSASFVKDDTYQLREGADAFSENFFIRLGPQSGDSTKLNDIELLETSQYNVEKKGKNYEISYGRGIREGKLHLL